jgi:predicted CXXCH cytochrome family protein
MFAIILVIAVIGAFGTNGNLLTENAPAMVNPGQLSSHHSSVSGENNCKSCHEPHSADSGTFLLAAFKPSGPSTDTKGNKCLTCHDFPAMKSSVHSSENCTSCHTEHKGLIVPTSTLTDKQCHTCHKVKFDSFSTSHPSFGPTYPYSRRTAINFDHTEHLNKHFKDARYLKDAPNGRCIGCHEVSQATNKVPIKKYEEVCAGCHESQIESTKIVLMQMPELEKHVDPGSLLKEACGEVQPAQISSESSAPEEYESISIETLNPILAGLLDVDPEDANSYGPKVAQLLRDLSEDNLAPLIELLSEAEGNPTNLLGGLSPSLLKAAACNWVSNKEHDRISDAKFGGWNAEELSITYTATRHGDPVLKEWIDFAALSENQTLVKEILNPSGAGNCIKCHSVSETDELRVDWNSITDDSIKKHNKYNHQPHLNVLGPGSQCETCHGLNTKADYASSFKQTDPSVFESNFHPIKSDVCSSCHQKEKISEACLTCHEYHEDSSFKHNVMSNNLSTQKTKSK